MRNLLLAGIAASAITAHLMTAVPPAPPLESAPFRYGAQVYNSAGQTINDTEAKVSFPSEEYDTTDFHDTSSNTTRLTVPTGKGITKVRLTATLRCESNQSGEFWMALRKNDDEVDGGFRIDTGTGGGGDYINAVSAVIPVTGGDYFEVSCYSQSNRTVLGQFAIEAVEWTGNPFKGALVKKTENQSVTADTPALVAFGAEVYDTNNFHDNSTNNSRLTIPTGSGITKVRLSATICQLNVTGDLGAYFLKNGSTFIGSASAEVNNGGPDGTNIMSAVVECEEGDYFEVEAFSGSNTSFENHAETWFQIEAMEYAGRGISGALVKLNSTFSRSNETAAVEWEAAEYDPFECWSGEEPTRLTVPAGVSYVRLNASLYRSSGTGEMYADFFKNGSMLVPEVKHNTDTSGDDSINLKTCLIPVVEGDYFEIRVFSFSLSLAASDHTWFGMEFYNVPEASGWEVVAGLNAPSSGVFAFNDLDLSDYERIEIHINGLTHDTDDLVPYVQFKVGGVAATHNGAIYALSTGGTTDTVTVSSASSLRLVADAGSQELGTGTGDDLSGVVVVNTPTSGIKSISWRGTHGFSAGSNNSSALIGVGRVAETGAIDGIVVGSSATVTGGQVVIMGLRKAA